MKLSQHISATRTASYVRTQWQRGSTLCRILRQCGRILWLSEVLLAPISSLLPATIAHAASSSLSTLGGDNLIINANSMSANKRVVELTGDVQLVYDGQHLMADRATVHRDTMEIVAEGNLVISSPTSYVEGSRAEMNYQTNTGVIYDGFVQSGQVVFEGRIIRKLGPDEYQAEKATYTACTTCPPGWSFSGKNIRARLGGYAHIKSPVLQISDVPVLWLPYLIVPLKSHRQTGLLIPSFDYSPDGGAAIAMPFFWAISRSQDATFSAKHYEKRGTKALVNYRYVLTETSLGESNFGYIRDTVFVSNPYLLANNPRVAGENSYSRWFFTYGHLYDLPNDYVHRAHLTFVSDLLYAKDFPDEIGGWGDPSLTNRISLTRNFENAHTSIEAAYYVNMLTAGAAGTIDPLGSNRDAVHRLPEIQFDLTEQKIANTGALFNLRTNYVNFARGDYAFDDVVGTGTSRTVDTSRNSTVPGLGVFNPGQDVIRAGQRLDVQPEITYPLHAGPLIDLLPSLALRHTQYSFGITPDDTTPFNTQPYRQYLRAQISARTRMSRVYVASNEVASKDERATRFLHEIQPELVMSTIPWIQQPEHSFFGQISQLPSFRRETPVANDDFFNPTGIQFDYHDRLTNRNVATFALTNKLVRRTEVARNKPIYNQIVYLKLAQSYDLDEAQKTTSARFPWSDISALLDVRLGAIETNTLLNYYPYHNLTNSASRVRLRNDANDFVELSFSQAFRIDEDTVDKAVPIGESVALAAGFNVRYLAFVATLNFEPISYLKWTYNLSTWATNIILSPPGDCWSIRFNVSQTIGALPSYKLAFDFQFGGI